jgi:hypothetical protein
MRERQMDLYSDDDFRVVRRSVRGVLLLVWER